MLSLIGWQPRREEQAGGMVSGPSSKNLASPLVCSVTLVKSYPLPMIVMCTQTLLIYLLRLKMLFVSVYLVLSVQFPTIPSGYYWAGTDLVAVMIYKGAWMRPSRANILPFTELIDFHCQCKGFFSDQHPEVPGFSWRKEICFMPCPALWDVIKYHKPAQIRESVESRFNSRLQPWWFRPSDVSL